MRSKLFEFRGLRWQETRIGSCYWKVGRNPSTLVDTKAYVTANQDLATASVNPLDHFLEYDARESRAIQVADGG